MLLASAWYNEELNIWWWWWRRRWWWWCRRTRIFEGSAKPREQIGSRHLAERVTILTPGLGSEARSTSIPTDWIHYPKDQSFLSSGVAPYVPGMEVPLVVIVESPVSSNIVLLSSTYSLQSPGAFIINWCLGPTSLTSWCNYSRGKFRH